MAAQPSPNAVPSSQPWRVARRALIGGLVIVAVSALTTATAALLEVGNLAQALRQNQSLSISGLASSAPGSPQTLLLVGDDQRPPPKGRPNGFVVPHSNEMLLVRLDPSKPTIAMLSIPRDLKATIYPHNARRTVKRINVAYTLGGIQLMTETIKRVTGVSVNHVVVITFPHFKQAVDAMGCVYTTVDRRYYHSNAAGGQQYFEVNLQPGYQQLCGTKALQFVAYRHGDTALIRDARDQRFLLDVKAQYGPALVGSRDKFEKIFGRAVQTDIHGTRQVLDLLELLVQMAGRPVRQVHFEGNIGPIFVTATKRQIQKSVAAFLNGVAPLPKQRIAASAVAAAHRHGRAASGLSLVRTPRSDLSAARKTAAGLPFALEYPRVRNQYASNPDALRVYGVRDLQGHVHVAYTIVIDRGKLGEFYDVQGTGWQDPPLIAHPDQTVRIGARSYGLYYEGDKLRMVAWREGKAVYWISNTLTDSVGPQEMIAMAQQTRPLTGAGSLAAVDTKPHSFVLPPRRPAGAPSQTLTLIGGLLGFLALVCVGALSLKLMQRAEAMRMLRSDCERMHDGTT